MSAFVKQALDTPTGTTVAPYPPASGPVKIAVDGIEATVDAGDNLIEAARKAGVEIPYFCYHPRLSIAGQCRMCLVETSDLPGRLVPGCQVRVKEGLKISTDTPAVKENQRAMMEFHLVNHPVDCPICDQSGECKLQDYFMKYDFKQSRLATLGGDLTKVNKPKRTPLGPLVIYDAERCILCTRCVRFMSEVAEEPQLAVMGRGDHSLIGTFPGLPLDSNYSGNTVDICPVGALLNRDFRFEVRVWYVQETPSLCTGCANGCNTTLGFKGDRVHRYLPRRNEEVNQVWLCDEGRLSYHALNENRLLQPTERAGNGAAGMLASDGRSEPGGRSPTASPAGGGGEVPHSVENAIAKATTQLKPLAGDAKLAVLVSARLSLEEQFAALALAKDLGVATAYAGVSKSGASDDFLVRADKDPNRNGLAVAASAFGIALQPIEALYEAIAKGEVKALLAAGLDVPDAQAAALSFQGLEVFVALSAHDSALSKLATVALPLSLHGEDDGAFVNWYGRLQRARKGYPPRGASRPAYGWASALSAGLSFAARHKSAAEVFEKYAPAAPALAGVTKWTAIGDHGVLLPGFAPKEFPRRAPHPTGSAATDGRREPGGGGEPGSAGSPAGGRSPAVLGGQP